MDFTKIRHSEPNPSVVAWVYLVASCIWIAASDRLLRHASADPDVLTFFSSLKGFLYVLVTTAVMYVLMRRLRQAKDTLEETVAVRTAALIDSEAQYRLLFDSNPLPMWVFDRKTLRFLAVNEAAVRHYGYSWEEFSRMTILDIRPAEEMVRILDRLSEPLQGLQAAQVWKHRKKDGSIIDMEITANGLNFRGADAI